MPLHDLELRGHHRVDGVDEEGAQDHQRDRQADAHRGQTETPGPPGHVAQHHAPGDAQQPTRAEPFEPSGPKARRRLRAHRLGRRQGHRTAYRTDRTEAGGGQADRARRERHIGCQAVDKDREAKVLGIDAGQAEAQAGTGHVAEHGPCQTDHSTDPEVMESDGTVAVADRFEHGDLWSLHRDHARENNVDQEGRDREKDHRQHAGHGTQLVQLVVDVPMRSLQGTG